MRVPLPMVQAIWRRCEPVIQRVPDEIIGHKPGALVGERWRATNPHGAPVERPFMLRWYIGGEKRRNRHSFNAYLHQFIRDDEDRALHDHPWYNVSLLLGGQYLEHTIEDGGIHKRTLFTPGDFKFRSPSAAHRVELTKVEVGESVMNGTPVRAPNLPEWVEYDRGKVPSWSLFCIAPVQRKWGFHCPESGWRSSREFGEKGGCAA